MTITFNLQADTALAVLRALTILSNGLVHMDGTTISEKEQRSLLYHVENNFKAFGEELCGDQTARILSGLLELNKMVEEREEALYK